MSTSAESLRLKSWGRASRPRGAKLLIVRLSKFDSESFPVPVRPLMAGQTRMPKAEVSLPPRARLDE
jgi:hypothetical protein